MSRKYLNKWVGRLEKIRGDERKVAYMRQKTSNRVLREVAMDWQAMSLAHQLYLAQRHTSERYHEAQLVKKGFLSLKYWTKFSQKQKCLQAITWNYEKERIGRKAIAALK